MRQIALFGLLSIALCISSCTRVETKSIVTAAADRYSTKRKEILLRPNKIAVSVPSNEIWALHTNSVSQGWPKNEPFVGKAWDRVEMRFALTPVISKRATHNEDAFQESSGSQLLILWLMQPMGADGDTRTAWKIVRLEPTGQSSQVALDAAKAAGAYPSPLVEKHHALGLDEYEGKDEFGSNFYKAEETIIRCWYPPFHSIKHVCESSFDLQNGLLVNVEFAYTNLKRWKELLNFSRQQAASYIRPKQ